MSNNRPVSRRDFLKIAGASAAGAVLASSGQALSSVAAKGASLGQKKQVKVTLWTHTAQDEQNWFTSEWKLSAAKNAPDYDVTLEIVPMAHGDLHAKALANMSAGQELPDMMGLTHDFWPKFLKGTLVEDNLAPINDLIADVKDNALGLGAWSKGDKLYGMRGDICSTAYWYRDDLLKASGIKMPIATWDDFMAVAKALKAPTKYMMPLVIDQLFFNYPMVSQLAGTYWTADGKWNLNKPETVEVLNFLKKGLDDKVFFPVGQTDFWGSKFLAGDEVAGAVMPTSWYGPFVLFPAVPDQKGKWRVQNLPRWGTRGHVSSSVWGGTAMTFSKASPNLDLILKIAKGMWFDTEARIRYSQIAKFLPAWKPALADPRVQDQTEPFLGDQAWNKVFFEGLNDSVQAIQNIADFDVAPLADDGWTKFMAGKMGAQEYLDSVDSQLKDLGIAVLKG